MPFLRCLPKDYNSSSVHGNVRTRFSADFAEAHGYSVWNHTSAQILTNSTFVQHFKNGLGRHTFQQPKHLVPAGKRPSSDLWHLGGQIKGEHIYPVGRACGADWWQVRTPYNLGLQKKASSKRPCGRLEKGGGTFQPLEGAGLLATMVFSIHEEGLCLCNDSVELEESFEYLESVEAAIDRLFKEKEVEQCSSVDVQLINSQVSHSDGHKSVVYESREASAVMRVLRSRSTRNVAREIFHGAKNLSSMRGDEAKEVCLESHLVQVPVVRGKSDLTIYRDASSEVVSFLARKGRCECASIDKAYLDLADATERMLKEMALESLEI
ncbi:DNA polymerase eta [Tanacetum coccineum]